MASGEQQDAPTLMCIKHIPYNNRDASARSQDAAIAVIRLKRTRNGLTNLASRCVLSRSGSIGPLGAFIRSAREAAPSRLEHSRVAAVCRRNTSRLGMREGFLEVEW